MHLVLGHPADPCCAGLLARFHERDLLARLIPDLLAPPARLAWRLDDAALECSLAPDGLNSETISSVLVRGTGWLDPTGWDPADHAYMQAEAQAALLAWLAALPCPVVNRPSAALWYRPRMPLLAWRPLLRRAGLHTPETLLTNDPVVARDFGRELEDAGSGGAVCTPLTGDAAWLVTDAEWSGLSTLQAFSPVCLVEPHGPAQAVCVVGRQIVWDGAPPPGASSLAPRLLRFADAADLASVEIAVAPVRSRLAIVLVEPLIRLDDFRPPAREQILDALVELLAGETAMTRRPDEVSA
ncbi:MAG TPA: hypothetical protein VMK32_07455 [Burkholderiaceae bacterium]|nr:hypothetical protein [Burkholderiaceae bacterium]